MQCLELAYSTTPYWASTLCASFIHLGHANLMHKNSREVNEIANVHMIKDSDKKCTEKTTI